MGAAAPFFMPHYWCGVERVFSCRAPPHQPSRVNTQEQQGAEGLDMTAVEDFGGSPDDFDLDAWLDQATRPRREVTIYRDWGLLAEYDRLVAAQDESADDDAMGEESVADRITDVLARMEASKLVLTVEALTQAEVKALAEQAPKVTVEGPDGKTREKVD